ncbi:MAG TPA: type IX secretion system membrane protein PorP/SprF [Brumimicrobium sp.]|nr:type IX secretion system membrane protein PorP/SprF [Brumimicrobium sp.]
MKTTLTIGVLFVTLFAFGQQEAHFSQYYNNPYFFNPAAGGTSKTINADLGYRKQWIGVEGSPQSLYATAHSEIVFDKRDKVLNEFNSDGESVYRTPENSVGINKHVIGGRILADEIGPFRKTSVMASYAYHLRFTEKTMLSLGVSAGLSNMGIVTNKVVLHDQDDAKYDDFLSRNSNHSIFDLNAGIAFYGEKFQFGISSAQLLKNGFAIDNNTSTEFGRHWYMYGMYNIAFKTSDISIEPHFMAQIIGDAPFSINVGARLHFDQRYWVNASYRVQDAITLGAGLNLAKNLRFGYSYDIAIGKVQRPSNYVHELNLGFTFGSNRNIEKELQDDEML